MHITSDTPRPKGQTSVSMIVRTPLGFVKIVEQDHMISEISFVKEIQEKEDNHESPILKEAKSQLLEYMAGGRKAFDLPMKEQGTAFQKKVWQALRSIPYGETRSYKQIAEMIGNPKASRAVGMANNKNPILLLTPCHRVLGSNGQLVGFAAGIDIKKELLKIENSKVFFTDGAANNG